MDGNGLVLFYSSLAKLERWSVQSLVCFPVIPESLVQHVVLTLLQLATAGSSSVIPELLVQHACSRCCVQQATAGSFHVIPELLVQHAFSRRSDPTAGGFPMIPGLLVQHVMVVM